MKRLFAALLVILGPALFTAGLYSLAQAQPPGLRVPILDRRPAAVTAAEGTVLIDVVSASIAGGNGVTSQTFANVASPSAGGEINLNIGGGPNGTTNRAVGAMLVFCGNTNGGVTSGVSMTYNGSSMGAAIGNVSSASAGAIYFFGIAAPTTGRHDFVASWTGANQATLALISVVGANQTGGATTFAALNSATGTSSVSSVTVTAPSTRISMGAFANNSANYTTPGTGNTDIGLMNTCNTLAAAGDYDTGHTNPALAYNPSASAWAALGVSIKGI